MSPEGKNRSATSVRHDRYAFMRHTNADLMLAEQHIAEGEQHVARQEGIVTDLKLHGADTKVAEELLAEFQATLEMHREDRDRIAKHLYQGT